MTRHSREDALREEEFEKLLDACERLSSPFDAQCLWILVAAGRLGLRAGEISHMRAAWVNWERQQIEIPGHEPCTDGANGGICGYCEKRAESAAAHNDDLTLEEARNRRWQPKTVTSARSVPFDFDPFVESVVQAFWADHERFPTSRASINRRVNRVLEAAGYDRDKTYPHALRATAAIHHAYAGVEGIALMGMFGWVNLAVAQKYVRAAGEQTASALREAHA